MRDGTTKLLSFIDECNKIDEVEQLRQLMRGSLRLLLPHDMAVCGIAELSPCRIVRLINVDFPAGYLQRTIRPDQMIVSPRFKSWLGAQTPMLVRFHEDTDLCDTCRRAAHDSKIDNIALYGVVDAGASTFSFFAFGNLAPSALGSYHRSLAAVVPHLHVALVRSLTRHYVSTMQELPAARESVVVSDAGDRTSPRTTERERQILQWISMGKSNREIAELLGISEFTVKTHVQNLLAKLAVTSRAQAVRKAIVTRLLEAK